MTVLYIIGVLVLLFALLLLVLLINERSEKRYGYEFFSYRNLGVVSIAYVLIYFGQGWYFEELANHGDILNGILLMGIGIIIILALLYVHIKNTSLLFGLSCGVLQLMLYVPASIISVWGVILVGAWLIGTKPVYRL